MELKKYVGLKIKEMRLSKGMNQDDLAHLLGTTKQSVSRYETGERKADQDVLFKLSEVFNVCIDDFFPTVNHDEVVDSDEYIYFPTAISAGLPLEVDGITESSKIAVSEEFLGKWKNSKDIFFAHIHGESMNELMDDGSMIGIQPVSSTDELKNGDIVVYSVHGDYSIKHYHRYGDVIVFKPNSTLEHEEHEYNINDDVKIHGKVVLSVNNYN